MASFSERLNKAIKQKGLKKKDLAEQIGTTAVAISRYATGKHLPGTSELHKLSRALEVSMNWLMGDEEKINSEDNYWKAKYHEAEKEIGELQITIRQLSAMLSNGQASGQVSGSAKGTAAG